MPRGLVDAESFVDVAKVRGINGGRGLVANERIRKRFIHEEEITLRTFWGNPVNPIITSNKQTFYVTRWRSTR